MACTVTVCRPGPRSPSSIDCCVFDGAGESSTAIGWPSTETRNEAACPQAPSPPDVVNDSVEPSRTTFFTTPGGVASVRASPLLCKSCWYFGHWTVWQASPAACQTNRLPSRVARATSTLPSPSKSPTPGVITDQPPVNLGQLDGAAPPSP